MITFRLNTIILKSFACLAVFVTVIQYCRPLAAAIAPERDVIIIDNPDKYGNPSWKNIWDEARMLSRDGRLAEAAIKYNKLLSIKPNIEEAKWEYCKVLVELKNWSDASLILESLLEIDPNRTDYLLKAGTVALNSKQYQQAVKYFGQVYQKGPFDPDAIEALEGLISGLQGLGKKQESFPLLQQLYLRKPNSSQVLLRLARLAKDLGWMGKAGSYYATLASKFKIEDQVLIEAAYVYTKQDKEDKAIYYQLKYLDRHPKYIPFQKTVADYYLKFGKNHLALPHLLILNEQGEGGDALLPQIAEIYLHEEDRPDKALFYLEKYQNRHPDDQKITKEIKITRTILANDLLSIVLNDGAAMLWRDLERITPNRQAIFETMADLLERRGKEKELFQVLEIVHAHNPQDKKIIWQLAELLFKKKRYKNSYNYIKLLDGSEKEFPRSLALRAQVEDLLGYQYAALSTYSRILTEDPNNLQARRIALKLAGNLGLVRELNELYREIPKNVKDIRAKDELENIYIDGLIENRMFSDVENIYYRFFERFSKADNRVVSLKLRLAESFYKEGQVFLAEQMVREILGENVEIPQALGKLSQMAFEGGNLAWGKAWLYLMSKKTGVNLLDKDYTHWAVEVFYQKVELFVAERQYETAITMLRNYLDQLEKNTQTNDHSLIFRAEMNLCRLLYKSGQYEKAKSRIHELLEKSPEEVELLVLLDKIQEIQLNESPKGKKDNIVDASRLKTFPRLKAAVYEYEYGALNKAVVLVHSFLRVVPSSVNARILEGKIFIAQKKFSMALKIFNILSKEFPGEQYFHNQVLELEFKQGNFKKLVQEIPSGTPRVSAPVSKALEIDSSNDFYWQRLLLARSLWAEGQLDASVKVYESLLNNPAGKVFLQKMNTVKADFHLPPLKRSFWDRVTFSSPQNDDPMATAMEPLFVGNHLGLPINAITAGLYEQYRWQKLIQNELSAKQAVQRRDYHLAEKEYKALIEKGDSDETIYDLAKVYSRLELYGKEGELYEQLKKKGSEYPELDDLVRQNTLKRLPRVSFDYLFLDEKGRDGYIDIRKRSAGIEGWRMPAFNQELNVRAERSYFISNDSTKKIWTTKLNSTYTINLSDDKDCLINLGGNFANSDANFLYKLELKGRMNEFMSGNIALGQGEVDDTIQALREGIYYRDFDVGVKIDSFPRMFMGGDFKYREYTDNNYQNRYHLWASYDLFGEVSLLQLKYDYTSLWNSQSNLGSDGSLTTDLIPGDLPYWSPDNYWQQLVTVHFKHDIDTENVTRTSPSYYTLDYSFGYENDSEVINSMGFNIFLEMSRHFLLKGNLKYYNSGDYRMNTGMLSVIYRW
jgi:lipopolysaccharide biosynthesis regulator YciM